LLPIEYGRARAGPSRLGDVDMGWRIGSEREKERERQRVEEGRGKGKGKEGDVGVDKVWEGFHFEVPGFHDEVFWECRSTIVYARCGN
jgi:hypothetical protein